MERYPTVVYPRQEIGPLLALISQGQPQSVSPCQQPEWISLRLVQPVAHTQCLTQGPAQTFQRAKAVGSFGMPFWRQADCQTERQTTQPATGGTHGTLGGWDRVSGGIRQDRSECDFPAGRWRECAAGSSTRMVRAGRGRQWNPPRGAIRAARRALGDGAGFMIRGAGFAAGPDPN